MASLHAAKGLEWDVVFLPGLTEGNVPIVHADSEEAVAEERRLLYVGVTRARQQVLLSWPLARLPGGRRNRTPSRFLDGLRPGRREARTARAKPAAGHFQFADADPALVEALREWRRGVARDAGVPAYVVFGDETLRCIAAQRPDSIQELARIPGLGPGRLDRYGAAVLALCATAPPRAGAADADRRKQGPGHEDCVGPAVSDTLDKLLDLLDLEQIELDIFRGRSPDDRRQRVFGGQVAGQALVAAGRTVPARPAGALAARVLHPARRPVGAARLHRGPGAGRAVVHHPAGVRDPARQGHLHPVRVVPSPRARAGPRRRHAAGAAAGVGAAPTGSGWRSCSAPAAREVVPGQPDRPARRRAAVASRRNVDPSLRTDRNLVWLRADGDLPDDPLLHVCLMTYASDMTLLDSVLLRHGLSWADGSTTGASLDHAMWFHRPFRADRWLLYAQESPSAAGARGLARGEVFTRTAAWWCRWCRRASSGASPEPS